MKESTRVKREHVQNNLLLGELERALLAQPHTHGREARRLWLEDDRVDLRPCLSATSDREYRSYVPGTR